MNNGEVSPLTCGEKGLCVLSSQSGVEVSLTELGGEEEGGIYHRFSLILTSLEDFLASSLDACTYNHF